MTLQQHTDEHDSETVFDEAVQQRSVVVIGAGPAGLTAALLLTQRNARVLVVESDAVVGGISRTVERDGWRFDIGGHRFFTEGDEVEALWRDLLGSEDFMLRDRRSRIFYDGRFYVYPLKPLNAVRNLGVVEATKCVVSYLRARVKRSTDTTTFEGWVASRFGWRLYRTFFKTYTEKVWGVPANQIAADWAAQRIKNLSLGAAVIEALGLRRSGNVVSLIEQFHYPRLGPGMMWEVCRERVEAAGGEVRLNTPVRRIERDSGGAFAVHVDSEGQGIQCDAVISSMPLGARVRAMDPPAPAAVIEAAEGLRYRDFLTVALVVESVHAFEDNWIYIHSPEVRVGRIQNFGAWSPHMVQGGRACLGLEYFVNENDDMWKRTDEELVELARGELVHLGLVPLEATHQGYVVRMPKAYPVYDADYARHVDVIGTWLASAVPNVQTVGRNGMHRYNNQDHSMLTAMLAVENLMDGTSHDLWQVNVDGDYHEERTDARPTAPVNSGRAAPLVRG